METTLNRPLLTIAIPTYNRESYLDLCLSQLYGQADRIGKDVELIVSDNASTDGTPQVVNKYRDLGVSLTYLRNSDNVGADANISQCFKKASGKYVLILADDDVLVDGAMDIILDILEKGDYGVVHLKSYPFVHDFRSEGRPSRGISGFTVYDDKEQFIKKVHIMLTFISGNIVNKTIVDEDLDIDSFLTTNLVQMSWTLSALVNAACNLYINDACIAAKAENTGGYKLCKVFGVNLRMILSRFESQGVPPNLFRGITTMLLCDFLPGYILKLRADTKGFHAEDFWETLAPVYNSEPLFWLATMPAIKLPLPLAKVWNKMVKKHNKFWRFFKR